MSNRTILENLLARRIEVYNMIIPNASPEGKRRRKDDLRAYKLSSI